MLRALLQHNSHTQRVCVPHQLFLQCVLHQHSQQM